MSYHSPQESPSGIIFPQISHWCNLATIDYDFVPGLRQLMDLKALKSSSQMSEEIEEGSKSAVSCMWGGQLWQSRLISSQPFPWGVCWTGWKCSLFSKLRSFVTLLDISYTNAHGTLVYEMHQVYIYSTVTQVWWCSIKRIKVHVGRSNRPRKTQGSMPHEKTNQSQHWLIFKVCRIGMCPCPAYWILRFTLKNHTLGPALMGKCMRPLRSPIWPCWGEEHHKKCIYFPVANIKVQ